MLNKRQPLREEPETDPQAEQKAVALKYDMERDQAPRVIAKGRGHVAENIMAVAKKSTIPVYQNKTLVNMLMALEIDREVPPELYRTVAEVMAHVYRIDKHAQSRMQQNNPLR
ncbi:MAG: EscU/YscU/HrcU family type III secretion system export apparatus switch protein [Lachnospiraceae bacterium]|nr:EscU/YscU/HrcU family type III secretion system export apparatus switch protein [Lachnospiraceae bacterium]